MGLVSAEINGKQEMVSYRLKRVKNKLYLVKEWIDPATGRKRAKSIGRVEWLEQLSDTYRQNTGKQPYLKGVAGPPGFEPGTTGLGDQGNDVNWKESFRSHGSGSSGSLGKLPLPEPASFYEWLVRSRGVSVKTAESYRSYLVRLIERYGGSIGYGVLPELKENSWMHKALRLIARYDWQHGLITVEDRDRVLSLLSSRGKRRRVISSPLVSMDRFRFTLGFLEAKAYSYEPAKLYHLMYIVMYYSGARVEEAEYLIRTAPSLKPVSREKSLEAVGYIELGPVAVRVALHYNRGNKRCDYLWLPTRVFEAARSAARLLARIEEKERGEIDLSERLSSYISNHRKRSSELKRRLLVPKMVRKLHMQVMEDIEVSLEIREVIQNRYHSLEDIIGIMNYSKILVRADQVYLERILPELERRLSAG